MKYLLILCLFTCACSLINKDSKDYYKQTHSSSQMRHGIIPKDSQSADSAKATLDQKSINRGKSLYQQHCLECHGPYGKGDGPKAKDMMNKPRNLNQIAKTVPQFKFYMMVSQFKGEMPGWKSALNDQEIKDIEQYIKHLAQ